MDRSLNYADILKQTLQEATRSQPRLQAIQLYSVCDTDSGHFLILATGWDKQRWIDTILFHARLVDRHVIIEEDNFEEGLTAALIVAGIQSEHIMTGLDYQNSASERRVSGGVAIAITERAIAITRSIQYTGKKNLNIQRYVQYFLSNFGRVYFNKLCLEYA